MTETFLDAPHTGVTNGKIFTLARARDTADALFALGVADALAELHASDHPDLAGLDARGLTITGKGADRTIAALELLGEEYAREHHLHPDSAANHIHAAFRNGHDYRLLYQALADGQITGNQTRTIKNIAAHLSGRIATLETVVLPSGEIEIRATEGEYLFDTHEYHAALEEFLTTALAFARQGHTGRKLVYRLNRAVRDLTPDYEPVMLEKKQDAFGVTVVPCEDGLHAHLIAFLPLADALRFQAHVTALADETARAERAAYIADDRTPNQRASDVVADLLRHAITHDAPAVSDRTEKATSDDQLPALRSHRPRSSTSVNLHMGASTCFGFDYQPGWVDGFGMVSAEVARDLAGNDGAMWRKVVTSPGTRDVLDVGSRAYEITEAMRRFITTRDLTCTSPGCQVPAIDCDIDHVIPHPQGETTVDNLVAKCRGCHRKKTQYVYEHQKQRKLRLYGPPPVPDDAPPPF
jgi:hypothetical protein